MYFGECDVYIVCAVRLSVLYCIFNIEQIKAENERATSQILHFAYNCVKLAWNNESTRIRQREKEEEEENSVRR